MPIDPANASELATIAREVGAEALKGNLRCPSKTGNWQLGDVDLGEHVDRYRDQRLMVFWSCLARRSQVVHVARDEVGRDKKKRASLS